MGLEGTSFTMAASPDLMNLELSRPPPPRMYLVPRRSQPRKLKRKSEYMAAQLGNLMWSLILVIFKRNTYRSLLYIFIGKNSVGYVKSPLDFLLSINSDSIWREI